MTHEASKSDQAGTSCHTVDLSEGVSVRAGINIALIKYWGKRDAAENLPAVGSLSLTLDALGTHTTWAWDADATRDRFELAGTPREDARALDMIGRIRDTLGESRHAVVRSKNSVPTASGLASSASGAAALVSAGWLASGRRIDPNDAVLRDLVRRASGSGPRSLLGGLVELHAESGQIEQVAAPEAWDLCMVVAVLTEAPKKTQSRPGMAHTAKTSPYYPAWIEHHADDLLVARSAIQRRDLAGLGEVMEHSTWKMHASMLAARPSLRYLAPITLAVIDAVEQLRESGVGAWYTMDAGPHVKVLCAAADAATVADAIRAVPKVVTVHLAHPGPGAHAVAEVVE